MTEHPLTDEICEQIRDSIPKLPCDEHGKLLSYDGQRVLDGMVEELSEVSNAEMRAAYDVGRDWQLEQVIDWLDENICNYDTGTESCPGFFRPMSRLTVDLEKAMRPATTTTTQENN